jgi:hypothetical protein
MMSQICSHAQTEIISQGLNRELKIEGFEGIVFAAIEDCFSSLGTSAKQAIYLHLKEHHNIDRTEFPSKIRDFAEALEESYGIGAKLIEIEIMKNIRRKAPDFKFFPTEKDLSFVDYVETLRYFL